MSTCRFSLLFVKTSNFESLRLNIVKIFWNHKRLSRTVCHLPHNQKDIVEVSPKKKCMHFKQLTHLDVKVKRATFWTRKTFFNSNLKIRQISIQFRDKYNHFQWMQSKRISINVNTQHKNKYISLNWRPLNVSSWRCAPTKLQSDHLTNVNYLRVEKGSHFPSTM